MVCTSWGKDSVVLLHLVQTYIPDVFVVHVGDEHRDEIDNFSEVENVYRSAFGLPHYHHIEVAIGEDSVTQAINTAGLPYLVRFLGLRMQEQGGRVYALRKFGSIHRYETGDQAGLWRVCPLINWTHDDVWAYIAAHDLPYLSFYDRYGPDARTSSVYSRRVVYQNGHGGVNYGRIARLREHSPAFYNRLVAISPALGAIV